MQLANNGITLSRHLVLEESPTSCLEDVFDRRERATGGFDKFGNDIEVRNLSDQC